MVVDDLRFLEGLLHLEPADRQGAHHLEREEADDVDRVVGAFQIKVRWEVEEFPEALR